ncbi:flagellar basal body P-ring protein FlgI [Rhodanobacter denitrificans]|uniref:flagellar basal body P-ring protein FlgI n=1 Tax=Rhodanobacter sp. OR92 TaxID=1076524 RepID=UPI001E42DFB6|nr:MULTISPECIES: flagellar basal body P-ring protein FlgI [Rhodanobacter]UJJ50196.1 flagellar basal body P-ring protein FlgI [Rhodanobacter denitrificans]UJJ57620.1 flagellar basal body P-ring protein FlgI [Rhodanobacter denitrificans]UJM91483.1 flagellar basal body P-ring protein FlgI [Rhodanobacter denitrificans]UJM92911.1 flagellar basal body P-ring protein FlgI [Rhodanobacter denitrificans]UJM96441.1 flagellar basal body P-ring protein FlgI [Rhodanobacter denitrificans]
MNTTPRISAPSPACRGGLGWGALRRKIKSFTPSQPPPAGRGRGAIAALLVLLLGAIAPAHADKIRDLVQVAGVRSNQLIGYGLVVGLDGSGDQTTQAPFTTQSLENMLQQFGITVPANARPQLKNAAAVMVTADLPPFAKPGQTIDVTVASIGNAKSIRGGQLLMAPLRGADGNVYAVAQGSVVVGGISAQGKSGSSVQVNISASGRIPNGASVERIVPSSFAGGGDLMLNLNTADFTTATRIATAVNRAYGAGTAQPLDGGSVSVRGPQDPAQKVAWLGAIENLDVQPGDAPARIVVNSRTGTVVIGSDVRVSAAAVAHGAIQVTISEQPQVSQPAPFGRGQTAVVPSSSVQVSEEGAHMFKFGPGVSLDTIVRAVNQVGATPSDLISILQALKQAGALHADLVVI